MSRQGQRIRDWMGGVDRSVTPVIATILIVALVIVIAASFGAVAFGFTDRLGSTEVAAGDGQCLQSVGFDPSDVESFADTATADIECVMWFDATQETYSDTEKVEIWTDRSANGYDVKSIDESPVYISDVDNTGVSGVEFDGDNENVYLQSDITGEETNIRGNSELEIITVLYPYEGTDGGYITISDNPNEELFAHGVADQDPPSWFSLFSTEDPGLTFSGEGDDVSNTMEEWTIITHSYDGSDASAYINGEFRGDYYDRNDFELNIKGKFEIGTFAFNRQDGLDGVIAEMIIFDRSLTNNEREVLECAIDEKYGSAVTVNHC